MLFEPEPIVWLQQLLGPGSPTPWRIVSMLGASWGIVPAVGLALWRWDRRIAYGVLAVGLPLDDRCVRFGPDAGSAGRTADR